MSQALSRTFPIGRRPGTTKARSAAALLVAALAGAQLLLAPAPAQAAARVSVSPSSGLDPARPTQLRVSGEGFQVVTGGFGGIYVFFGWVDDPGGGGWGPSRGGRTGTNYRYVPDQEMRDNQGYQRFVAFPGGSTANEANGGVLADDGSWSLTMNVPGARFEAADRTGRDTTVDCLEVTCGIITIGAHGIANGNNETFTPLRFAQPSGGSSSSGSSSGSSSSGSSSSGSSSSGSSSSGSSSSSGGTTSGATSGSTSSSSGSASGSSSSGNSSSGSSSSGSSPSGGAAPGGTSGGASGDAASAQPGNGSAVEETGSGGDGLVPGLLASVGVDPATAVIGRALTFTAQGLRPGEQTVATLDGGIAAVGPLPAGNDGELAGVIQLPADLAPGTYTLRVTGAASGARAEVEFAIRGDARLVVAATPVAQAEEEASPPWTSLLVGAAALLLLTVLVAGIVGARARRRAARRAAVASRGPSGTHGAAPAYAVPPYAIPPYPVAAMTMPGQGYATYPTMPIVPHPGLAPAAYTPSPTSPDPSRPADPYAAAPYPATAPSPYPVPPASPYSVPPTTHAAAAPGPHATSHAAAPVATHAAAAPSPYPAPPASPYPAPQASPHAAATPREGWPTAAAAYPPPNGARHAPPTPASAAHGTAGPRHAGA